MKRRVIVGAAWFGAVLLSVVLWASVRRPHAGTADVGRARAQDNVVGGLLSDRTGVEFESDATPVGLSEGTPVPRNADELAELVAWMRRLDQDELRRISNADYDFRKSDLIELLQGLEGPWVVEALGNLAITEREPLLKAILIEGLVGAAALERIQSPQMMTVLHQLVPQMGRGVDDPFAVGKDLMTMAYMACAEDGQAYAALVEATLAGSDNRSLLIHGYLFLGQTSGSERVLEQMLVTHSSAEGRMGALEGLRASATDGRISPDAITALALTALEGETSPRNRLLLYEMMISTGGESGLGAIEEVVRNGDLPGLVDTVEMFALKAEPARAMALLQQVLSERQLDENALAATYRAIGLVPGAEGQDYLLGLAKDSELAPEQRLAGLRGLWNREVDPGLATELTDVFTTTDDSALRTEALRMLAYGEAEGGDLDMRQVAAADRDPLVRAEATMLAATQPSADAREWLEERLYADESMDVKAAALGALVYHAHYTGDGDEVLGYLAKARRFTDDESALAMIAEGERMVKSHDPRALDLGLAHEAEVWGTIARYTSGPSKRAFERRAKQLQELVATLRASSR